MTVLFVTGTDTGVGKTLATCLLTEKLNEERINVFPYKPIETGITEGTETRDSHSYQCVFKPAKEFVTNYQFKHAYSPHLAAKLENCKIELSRITERVKDILNVYDGVIIEGAGGLYVPINEQGDSMIDLIKRLGAKTILVAHAGLGTINHTLLSYHALTAYQIPIVGILYNFTGQDPILEKDNQQMIWQLTQLPIIGTIPYQEAIDRFMTDKVFRNALRADWDEALLKNL